MTVTKKHYVVFESPGTMFAETSSKEIGEWSPALAVRMAYDVVERHNAKPACFRFKTMLVSPPIDGGQGGTLEVVPKTVRKSGRYFINGTLRTLDDVELAADPDERILMANMAGNDWPIVCETRNSFRSTQPFEREDFVVDGDGRVIERGDDPKHVAYRADKIARVKAARGY